MDLDLPLLERLSNAPGISGFEGATGPYIQYTYARIKSIIRKSKVKPQASSPCDAPGADGA